MMAVILHVSWNSSRDWYRVPVKLFRRPSPMRELEQRSRNRLLRSRENFMDSLPSLIGSKCFSGPSLAVPDEGPWGLCSVFIIVPDVWLCRGNHQKV